MTNFVNIKNALFNNVSNVSKNESKVFWSQTRKINFWQINSISLFYRIGNQSLAYLNCCLQAIWFDQLCTFYWICQPSISVFFLKKIQSLFLNRTFKDILCYQIELDSKTTFVSYIRFLLHYHQFSENQNNICFNRFLMSHSDRSKLKTKPILWHQSLFISVW